MSNFITSILSTILVFAGITGTINAANFTDTSFGISIDVHDTLSKQPLLRDIQYFSSEDKSGSLMIKQIHDLSIVDFLNELRDTGYRNSRDGINLGLTDKPMEADIESGRGLLMPVRGRLRGHWVSGVIGAYSGHDSQGFLVIGTAKPEHWATWKPRMKTMFDSIRFVKVDREAMVKNWENRLKGKKLQHKNANTGVMAPLALHLCSDGTVMHEPAAVSQVPGYGNVMQQPRSMWRVTVTAGAPYLIIRDDPEKELILEDEGEAFLLNGKPTNITASDLCK